MAIGGPCTRAANTQPGENEGQEEHFRKSCTNLSSINELQVASLEYVLIGTHTHTHINELSQMFLQ